MLFPEYKLYTLALKAKNKHEKDGLTIFALSWIVLKISLLLGLVLQFSGYMQLRVFALQIFVTTSMLAAVTITFYIKIYKNLYANI